MIQINFRPVSRRPITDCTITHRNSTIVSHWSIEQSEHFINIQAAMAAVDKGNSLRFASERYGIPCSTIMIEWQEK